MSSSVAVSARVAPGRAVSRRASRARRADSRVARRLASPRSFAFEGEASETAFEGAGYGTTPTGVSPAVGAHNPTGGNDDMDVARVLDPYGLIGDVMSSPAQTLTPELELDDPVVRQSLERYHGLPVVDPASNACLGVLSRSDLNALHGETAARTVGEAMTAPPVWCARSPAAPAPAPPPRKDPGLSDRPTLPLEAPLPVLAGAFHFPNPSPAALIAPTRNDPPPPPPSLHHGAVAQARTSPRLPG